MELSLAGPPAPPAPPLWAAGAGLGVAGTAGAVLAAWEGAAGAAGVAAAERAGVSGAEGAGVVLGYKVIVSITHPMSKPICAQAQCDSLHTLFTMQTTKPFSSILYVSTVSSSLRILPIVELVSTEWKAEAGVFGG